MSMPPGSAAGAGGCGPSPSAPARMGSTSAQAAGDHRPRYARSAATNVPAAESRRGGRYVVVAGHAEPANARTAARPGRQPRTGPRARSATLLHRRAASHRHLHPLRAPPAPGRPAGSGGQHLRRVFGRGPRRARLHGLRRRRQALHPRLLRPMHPGAAHRRVALRPQRHRAQHACRGARRRRGDPHPTHRAELAAQGAGAAILAALARGDIALTHEALDAHPTRRAADYLRAVLVAHDVLPPRDEPLARLERAVADLLARVPAGEDRRTLPPTRPGGSCTVPVDAPAPAHFDPRHRTRDPAPASRDRVAGVVARQRHRAQ